MSAAQDMYASVQGVPLVSDPVQEACANCRFLRGKECRRRSPRAFAEQVHHARWPEVHPWDWCGEHEWERGGADG